MAKTPPPTKNERIAAALADCAVILEANGVKYFLGVVDRDDKDPNGGKAYAEADCTGEEMELCLSMLLKTPEDLVNFGTYLGRIIQARKEQKI